MSLLQYLLFIALGLMVAVWFVCLRRFVAQMRDKCPQKYDQMRLVELWPQDLQGWLAGFNNFRPVFAILRFILCRQDRALGDADISALSNFMRWFFYVYLGLFLLLGYLTWTESPRGDARPGQHAVDLSTQREQQRARAFELHRAQKWPEAISIYDDLLVEWGDNAELSYWRGMAHWQLGHTDQALWDFKRVIELEPTNFTAHRSADRILSQQKRWDEILAIWDRYIKRAPADAEAYFERGGTHFHKGNLEAAHADAARACELGKPEACPLALRLKKKL